MPRVITSLVNAVKSSTRSLATTIDGSISNQQQQQLIKGKQDSLKVTTSHSNKLFKLIHNSIDSGEAHFKIGGKKLYFPTARVILLRPNAKHTPYQAKFIVPKSFNRMDLRDYLYHVYGLRAFNITTQLQHSKFTRDGNAIARYRTGQIKKMTIEMVEPFIWPQEPKDKNPWNVKFFQNLEKYAADKQRLGSDQFKPSEAFDGALGPYKPKPQPFIPKHLKNRLINEKTKIHTKHSKKDDIELVSKYLNL
ncbi:hypothetical protein WICMUC_000828 [Wickerhamomyces mucosus]|uniref:Large ribosomal subunit protein uL23m n=1 Tax=Wickerhamomyces mucosus TaxID=1378264 RepID=A0A9P8TIG7_9ASCO|nr:hypothetical protein WICMUC_000828 [Wickerhamomyces mucosus]